MSTAPCPATAPPRSITVSPGTTSPTNAPVSRKASSADQQVGPRAERVGDVLEQALQVVVRDQPADQEVDGDHRERHQRPDAEVLVAQRLREPHGAGPAFADDRVVAVEPRRRRLGRGEVREEAEGGRSRAAHRGQRGARIAQGRDASPISGRSERAAGSRSLTSSSA